MLAGGSKAAYGRSGAARTRGAVGAGRDAGSGIRHTDGDAHTVGLAIRATRLRLYVGLVV